MKNEKLKGESILLMDRGEERRENWKVDIDTYEGPLDLLLHLIKKKNLDIYDIPISEITSEYIKYLEIIKHMNFNSVGDFLVMASHLMRIKSKMLLPVEETEESEEENVEEMKQNLIQRLLEYKKYKESAEFFKSQEEINKDIFGLHQYPIKEFGYSVEATLFDLIDAFSDLIANAKSNVKDIITDEISVEEKIRYILSKIEKCGKSAPDGNLKIQELIEDKSSLMDLIVTLLAILELVRTHQIKILQKRKFSSIYVGVYEPSAA